VCIAAAIAPAGIARAQVGACCLCTGQCIDNTSATACQAQNGMFYPGQLCAQINCREWGACCVNGVCIDSVFFDVCAQMGGAFYPCQRCADVPCDGPNEQACCFCDGVCQDLPAANCTAAGGIPVAGSCATVTCEPYGACCVPGAGCVDNVRKSQCPTGADWYECTPCTQQPCGPQACCYCNGACADLLSFDCTATGGTAQGPGTSCATVQCLPTGACCYLQGPAGPFCVDDVVITSCPTGTAMFYPCQDCADIPCGTEACCLCDGTCVDLPPQDCTAAGGTPQGPGSICATITCPRRGACCIGTVCIDNLTAQQCQQQGGVFHVCQNCNQVVCVPVGACCFTCQPPPTPPCPKPPAAGPPCVDGVTKLQCEQNLHGIYRGDGTLCITATGAPLCRCIGDVNGDGVTNALDFNILAGNFGGGIPNCKLHSQGDLNCDGVVNALDFNILAGNFGCN